LASWFEHQDELLRPARRKLFFVGGAPRSGTTWLQSLLDSHPEISCRGEGLFMKHPAEPLDTMMAARHQALAAKNTSVFRHSEGYKLPEPDDGELLLGTCCWSRWAIKPTHSIWPATTPANISSLPPEPTVARKLP
jgi:hypothetical protein